MRGWEVPDILRKRLDYLQQFKWLKLAGMLSGIEL